MEITQERIEREFGIDIVATAPNVTYHVYLNNGENKIIDYLSIDVRVKKREFWSPLILTILI